MVSMKEFGMFMFKSVVMIRKEDDNKQCNGFLYACVSSPEEVIPFIVTSKSFITEKTKIIMPYLDQDEKLQLGSAEVDKDKWYFSDASDIAIYPCGPFMNAIKEKKNKVTNIPLLEKMVISSEEEDALGLIERTFSIGYINDIHNTSNFWPLSYIAYTASPISQNFDGKPYFIVNGSNPTGILGSPVFVKCRNKGMIGYRFVGMWVDPEGTKDNVGDSSFSVILKAKQIVEFINITKTKIEQINK